MEKNPVNFFIVGAPRSGTTSISSYLNGHPEIFMSAVKEPHHFCTDLQEQSDSFYGTIKHFPFRFKNKYDALFERSGDKKIVCESSTSYLFSKSAASNLYAYNNKAKIVAIIRNPIDFLYSYYHLLKFYREETAKSFEDALSLEESRKINFDLIPKTVRHPSRIFYSEVASFSDQLLRYQEVFPPHQIKFILFDDFINDTPKVFAELLDFLEIDSSYTPNFYRQYPSMVAKPEWLKEWFDKYIEKNKLRLPDFAQQFVTKVYWRLFVVKGKVPKMSPNTRQELQKSFSEEVEKLSQILGQDLAKLWNY